MVQFDPLQFSTVQYSSVEFSTVRYSALQYSTMHFSALHFTPGQCSAEFMPSVLHNDNQLLTIHQGGPEEMKSNRNIHLARVGLAETGKTINRSTS